MVAAPETCIPPPFPGFGVPAVPFTSFILSADIVKVTEPSITSIPPPALFALFWEITASVIVILPSVLKIPPPEPEAPVARLLEIFVPAKISSVPPLLKTPPPPSSAAAPCASLLLIVPPFIVITPVPFQTPPPSRAAILVLKLDPEILESAEPVI